MADPSRLECEVLAVVVTLSESPRLRRAIASVRECLRGVDGAIVVVQNSVGPVSSEMRDGVRWLSGGMNLGWAAGMHAGLLGTASEYVWAMQDDIVLAPDAYQHLRDALAADTVLGSVRPLPADDDGLVHPGFAGAHVNDEGRFTGGVPAQPIPVAQFDAAHVGSFLPSSAQLIRRPVWDALGGFDPWIYPWGYIDIDFGRTLTSAGRTFRIVPEARMTHAAGASTNQPFREYLTRRNRLLFTLKWHDDAPPGDAPGDPGIVQAMRGGRGRPRDVDLDDLRLIAGTAAADCLLGMARELPGLLQIEREGAQRERDVLRGELEAVAASRAWRLVTSYRKLRSRIPGPPGSG